MIIDNLNETFDSWLTALEHYDLATLITKPDPENWSLGQVFHHLIHETNYYIDQIEDCLAHEENSAEHMTSIGQLIFANNEFPDERLKNDGLYAQNIPQPDSREDLLMKMRDLKTRLNWLWKRMNETKPSGKTKHPGLGFFNAFEWLQFAELHMRHHLRQRKRIEQAIKYNAKRLE